MSSVVNENNQGIIVNKRNLIIKGNTIININDYKSDKSISRDGKFRIKSDDKYYNFNIPVLNKIDDSVYDSLDNLVYTKKIQSFTVDENCYFAGGRGVNYSKDYISSSDNQFWFMIYLNKMGLPSSIRDKGKILCKYPNISLWIKKEVGINVAYPDLICVHLDLSFFENDSIPKDAEELKEYFRTHENKKFNIYYELAIPEVEELKNETIILDENSQCIIIDEAYDGDKNLLKTYDIKDNLKLLNEINDTLFGEDRTYYSSEFGCSYSEVSSICSGSKGSNKIYIEDLALEANMNVQYFCRFFKSVIGKTPVEYINSYRIEKATELLQTETLSISNIALSVGIDNFSYFVKQFKKYKNCTPSQYRKSL